MKKLLLVLLLIPSVLSAQFNDFNLFDLTGLKEQPRENMLLYSNYYYYINSVLQYTSDGKMFKMDQIKYKFIRIDWPHGNIYLMRSENQDVFKIMKIYKGDQLYDKSVDLKYNCLRYECNALDNVKTYWEYRYYYSEGTITFRCQYKELHLEFVCESPKIIE